MSFPVRIERIERIWLHPNADRLELTALAGKGYQLIVPRGRHQPGDEVLLFPLDALLPFIGDRLCAAHEPQRGLLMSAATATT